MNWMVRPFKRRSTLREEVWRDRELNNARVVWFSINSGSNESADTNTDNFPYAAEFNDNYLNNHPVLEAKRLNVSPLSLV